MPTYAVGVGRRVEMTLAAVKLTQAQAARMTSVSPQVLNNFLRRPKGGAGGYRCPNRTQAMRRAEPDARLDLSWQMRLFAGENPGSLSPI